jgi:hypothetical protein
MAIARTAAELRRWSDLAAIRRALATTIPALADQPVGLMQVAEACRRRTAARPSRDLNEVRDLLLTVGCEWDLACDRLDEQSGACLHALTRLLIGR